MTRHIIAAILFVALAASTTSAFAVKIGAPAPDFTLKDVTGKAVSLSSFKGKTVILNFWSTSCPPCLAELPSLENLHREMGKTGVVVIGVAVERDVAAVNEVLARKKLTFPVLIDPDKEVYFDSYALFGLPITLIINREGIVVERVIGEAAWDSAAMKEKIRNLR